MSTLGFTDGLDVSRIHVKVALYPNSYLYLFFFFRILKINIVKTGLELGYLNRITLLPILYIVKSTQVTERVYFIS